VAKDPSILRVQEQTRQSYEDFGYPSGVYYHTHPDRIAITGALAGHSSISVNRLFSIGLACAPKAQISHSSLCHARGSLQSAIGGT